MRFLTTMACFCLLWVVYSGVVDKDGNNYIYTVIPDYRWYYYKMPTGNAIRNTMHIDDVTQNKTQVLDLIKTHRQRNDKGEMKYYIKNGVITTRVDWESDIPVLSNMR